MLQPSSQLATAAQRHSDDMAAHDRFEHIGSDGSLPLDRVSATGYQIHEADAAENIAKNYRTPEALVQGWLDDPEHNKHILNCNLHEIGVGYATSSTGTVYWTQTLATPR